MRSAPNDGVWLTGVASLHSESAVRSVRVCELMLPNLPKHCVMRDDDRSDRQEARTRSARGYTITGIALETFVGVEIIKQARPSAEALQVFHFRDRDGSQVDLILETRSGQIAAIEVKAARSVSTADLWDTKNPRPRRRELHGRSRRLHRRGHCPPARRHLGRPPERPLGVPGSPTLDRPGLGDRSHLDVGVDARSEWAPTILRMRIGNSRPGNAEFVGRKSGIQSARVGNLGAEHIRLSVRARAQRLVSDTGR